MNVVTEILNNRSDYVALMMYLLILFGMGYFCGWFFRGGVLRIMFGLVIAGFPIAHVYSDGTLTVQLAFFGGFLANWFSVFKRLREWLADTSRDFGYRIKQLFTLPKRQPRKSRADKRAKKQAQKQAKRDDEAFQAEHARRQAEMERQRAQSKAEAETKANKQRGRQQSAYGEQTYQEQSEQSARSEKSQQAEQAEQEKVEHYEDKRTALEILGLVEGQSYTADDIKKAYRQRAKELHPDKWVGKPPHLVKTMEEEMAKVNRAYERLKY